jgi:hypothetical protein
MNPTDPKVPYAAAAAGVAGAIVVLIMNLINREPLNQVALETVITAVVVALLAFGAGWLKRTPLDILVERAAASPQVAKVEVRNADGNLVAGAGTFNTEVPGPTPPGPNEFGHVTGALIAIMVVIALAVTLLVWLLLRAV